jgi:uncharacterized membrane protein
VSEISEKPYLTTGQSHMKPEETVPTYFSSFKLDYLEKRTDQILICIPVFLLLALTLPFITGEFWSDEIFSMQISRSWSVMLEYFRKYENNMSLYYITLHGWTRVFGDSEVAAHSLSLLYASFTLPVFYKLARVWLNKSTALLCGILLAANPLFVFFSLEVRSYAMLVLACTISTLIFVRLARKPGLVLAICYGLSVVMATYAHYFGILLILVHALTIPWRKLTRSQIIFFFVSGCVILSGILPLLIFQQQNESQVAWLTKPDLKYLWYTCKDLVGGGYDFLILLFCLFFVVKKGYWKYASDDEVILRRLALAWTLVPTLLLFVFSYLEKPVFLTRYFVWCVPGAVLLISLIISYTGWDYKSKSVVWLLLSVIMIYRSYMFLNLRGSGYKQAVGYLNQTVRPGETVITYPYYKSFHVSYYLDKMLSANPFAKPQPITRSSYLTGGGGTDPDPDMELVNRIADKPGRIYLITREIWDSPLSDSIQNRTWLPKIQKIILSKHSKQTKMIFGAGTLDPIRVIAYQ